MSLRSVATLALLFGASHASLAAPETAASAAASAPSMEELFAGTLAYRGLGFGEKEPALSRDVPTWAYAGPRPVARTDLIEAKPGMTFGLLLVVEDPSSRGLTDLAFVTRAPAPGVRSPGDAEPRRVFESHFSCLLGIVCDAEWSFDHSWEIVPGDWEFEIRSADGKRRLSHVFHVVAPAG